MTKKGLTTQYSQTDEINELQSRLKESEETLNAIRNGEVDSIVVCGAEGEKIFSLTSSETPYRIFLEEMEEGAVTLNSHGMILYCNHRFSTLLSKPISHIVGSGIKKFISLKDKQKFSTAFKKGRSGRSSEVISFIKKGNTLPLHLKLSFRALSPDTASDICVIASDVTSMKKSQQQLEILVKKRTADLEKDITVRKLAEQALRESEIKYKELIRQAPTGIYEIDFRSKKIVSVNDAMCLLTGYSRDEFLSMSPYEILDDEGKKAFQMRINMWLSGKKPVKNIEYKITSKDGHLIYVLLNVKFKADEKGNPTGAIVVAHDITERKLTEETLLKNEKLLKSVLDNVNSGVALIDEKGRITVSNPLFLKLFGLSEDSTIKNINDKDWDKWKVFNEDGTLLQLDDHPVRKAALTGKRIDQQLVGVKLPSGGEIVWMLISAEPILKDDGKIEKIICTYNDITRLKEAEKSVKEIKDKLDIALGIGNIGVWDWNLKTDKVIWDERLEIMFGLKTGTFGKTFQSFENLVNEEDIPHVKKSIKEALEKNLPLETIFRTSAKTGKIKYISSKGLVIKDKEGNLVSISGVSFDVTGLKEGTELLISKLNEELLRSNQELQSFAYVASHDLQEPLRMVTSFTQLLSLKYGDKLDENAKEYINFAVDGAKRMYDLLNGLLAYSHVNTKAQEFKRVDMNSVLSSVTKNLFLLIKERRTEINALKLPVVFADESQMIQLFQNLISNSIKFSTRSPKIFISVKNKKDQFVFSVKDEGIGIEPRYFERIFLIFQRLLPREKFEGTGVGLAVCKRIVERHGGEIWVESVPEKGSTFIFTIPNWA